MKRIVADQPDLFAIDRSSFYDKRRRQDPIDPMTKWKHDDFTNSVRALEQFLHDMSGLQNYNLYEPVIISNTGGVLDQHGRPSSQRKAVKRRRFSANGQKWSEKGGEQWARRSVLLRAAR